jgi:phi LC3 family holin
MKKIDWKVRFQNPKWVVSFISQLLIVAQLVVGGLNQSGILEWNWSGQIDTTVLAIVNAVLIVLGMLGLVQNPLTNGYSDKEPK